MIWGEIINQIRSLHLELFKTFDLPERVLREDVDLSAIRIHFPEPIDDFDEWNETLTHSALDDLIALHPVERALVEGPLLPIQRVFFNKKAEVEELFGNILSLEKAWLKKLNLNSPAIEQFLETSLAVASLKISVLAGFGKLTAVKGVS